MGLFQQVSMLIQETSPTEDEIDTHNRSSLVLVFLVFNPADLYNLR